MASTSILSAVNLECPICLRPDLLQSPLILPCQSVYCIKHLNGTLNEETGLLKCPGCFKDHEVPTGGVSQYPRVVRSREDFPIKAKRRKTQEKGDVTSGWMQEIDTVSEAGTSNESSREVETKAKAERTSVSGTEMDTSSQTKDETSTKTETPKEKRERLEKVINEINREFDDVLHIIEEKRHESLKPYQIALKRLNKLDALLRLIQTQGESRIGKNRKHED